ncbi:hypothetical protein D9757_001965 [Collybiopsis confluens]|uniref:Peptidase A1 domain-containing protein n=1 Tax=Collybiopsis confluens TaxID=2823264 RepID=A0A8H5HXP7_9AGAR|nr:hypothetical protein D9757_001965 [Collybiopsis confluens]
MSRLSQLSILFFLTLFALVSAGSTKSIRSDAVQIPLHRTLKANKNQSLQSRQFSQATDTQGEPREQQDSGRQIYLTDFLDVTYSIDIEVSGVELTVIVDTGSSDFWMISDTCNLSTCARLPRQSGNDPQLYPESSSYTHPNVSESDFRSTYLAASLLYGDSRTGTQASGVIGSSNVKIGTSPADLPVLKSQYFAAINNTNTSVLETGCVGILGLGFPLHSVLLLEVFQKDHPEFEASTGRNHLGLRSPKSSSEQTAFYSRRTFPNLSGFNKRLLAQTPATKRLATLNRGKIDHDEDFRRRQTFCGQSEVNSTTTPWAPRLLSTLNVYGPPVWRLVTNTANSSCAAQTDHKDTQTFVMAPMFTVSLQRDINSENDDINTGVLTIGGLPPDTNENEFTWVDVRRYGVQDGGLQGGAGLEDEVYPITWEIPIDDVFFDGTKLPRSALVDPQIGVTGLIDTGNSLIRGPPDLVQHIVDLVEGNSQNPSCMTPHTLAFRIGGAMFAVDPRDLFWESKNGTDCHLNVVPTDVPMRSDAGSGQRGYLFSWNLGDPFLKRLGSTTLYHAPLSTGFCGSVWAAFYYGNTTHPSVDPPRIGLKSTAFKVIIHPDVSNPLPQAEGAIPGVIQRPGLPSALTLLVE